jgi:beta-fructofuranosidase
MYTLPDAWTWDMWFADDGERFHCFYLKASRALHDPGRRHLRASVGHAVSTDLWHWEQLADALVPADSPAFDDYATWTGSVVRGRDGLWRMFYTGCSRAEAGQVQRIGVATSHDLVTWRAASSEALLEADERWYERLASGAWFDEAWRDPWVFPDPDGAGWHMLLTARARDGAPYGRGVVGHATSPDLETWTVRPPLSANQSGFGQLEVLQVEEVDGRPVLIFNCLHTELTPERRAAGEHGGIWSVPVAGLTGPYDVSRATRLTDESLYCGRLVQDREGAWWLLAFHHTGPGGAFVGGLSDPMPVEWGPDGNLRVAAIPTLGSTLPTPVPTPRPQPVAG